MLRGAMTCTAIYAQINIETELVEVFSPGDAMDWRRKARAGGAGTADFRPIPTKKSVLNTVQIN
jgi:hypothetical protein